MAKTLVFSTAPRKSPNRARPLQTVERALAVLECVASEPGQLTAISRRTGLHASTTFRMLETLRRRGYVDPDPDTGVYRVAARAFEVGCAFVGEDSLRRAARPAMRALNLKLNENVNLVVRDESDALYLDQIEARHTLRMFTRLGARIPLHCTAAGKVLLSDLDEPSAAAILGPGPYKEFTPRTITTLADMLKELAACARRGYATDNEEREPGIRCVAAPVRNRDGTIAAAISLSGPASRVTQQVVPSIAEAVAAAARETSQSLGYHPAPAAG